MKKIILAATLLFSVTIPLSAQLVLDDFNSSVTAGEGTYVSGTSWESATAVTQNPTTITVGTGAKDDNGWGFVGIDVDASTYNQITIVGQRDVGNLATSFQIEVLNDAFATQVFSVAMTAFNVGSMTTVNIPIAWNSYNATHIVGWSIGGGIPPTGTDAFRMTLDSLSFTMAAVPEPSTYAMIAGVLALGFVAWRRRSVSV